MAKKYLVKLNKSGKSIEEEVVANSQKEAIDKAKRMNPGYKTVISAKDIGRA